MSAPTVLVRADASTATGMGHVMRCAALVEEVEARGGRAVLLASRPPAAARSRVGEVVDLHAAPGTDEDAAETAAAARCLGASWVVLDGYHFAAGYHRALVASGTPVLALEDHGHLAGTPARLVLNPNLGAEHRPAPAGGSATGHLRGSRYALVRREYLTAHQSSPRVVDPSRRGSRVLVTLGGGDADDVTSAVLRALDRVAPPLEVIAVLGGSNPHDVAVGRAADASRHTVRVLREPPAMARLALWADVAVAAGGGTAWELAAVGTPQCTVVLADNQRPAAAALHERGMTDLLGWWEQLDPVAAGGRVEALLADGHRRQRMALANRSAVDGLGPSRVVDAMVEATPR